MKKAIALILFVAMTLSLVLAGCSSNAGPNSSPQGNSGPAENNSGSAENNSGSAENNSVEPMSIEFSTTYQQTETAGKIIQYFADYLDQISDGQISVNISWGGTLFDASSELSGVSEGAVNMIAFQISRHLDEVPLLSLPTNAPNSSQFAVDYYNYLIFENEETAALISEEASRIGVKYLNVLAGGPDAFCASFDFSTLDELVAGSSAFGSIESATFEKLGLHCTSVMIGDRYDALDRGIIDATTMSISPIASMGWYEVAPYIALNGLYTAGNFFTVNEKWWNGLSGAQRELIQQAADKAESYCVELINNDIDSAIEIIESNGGTVRTLSADDVNRWWSIMFSVKLDDAMARAANFGIEDNMTTVFKAAAEFTGYEWQD